LARLFPAEQVLGGHCFVCLNRVAPGVIRHTDHGQIVIGEYRRPPQPRTQQIAGLFRDAGVRCEVTDDLARAHWEKLVWNIPFNGLGVAGTAGFDALNSPQSAVAKLRALDPCLTTDKLLADPRWERLLRELMMEVIVTAAAIGLVIPESFAEEQIARTRTMGAYKASTLLDFENGLPLELESMFGEPLRQAQRAKVPTPRLQALFAVLTALDKRRGSLKS
jgi:2-dehydropantoate 2-reductase